MSLKHLILTEPDFRAPNWAQGLRPVSIVPWSGGEPVPLGADAGVTVVWVLSSLPGWQALIRHYSERSRVMVFTKMSSLPEMQKALEAGARGYMEVLAHPVQLDQAASTVSQGALWIAPPMLSRLLGILARVMPEPQIPVQWEGKLSNREQQVAKLVALGMSNREVAEKLNITIRTVKEHLTSVFGKLGINDRLQLVIMARRHTGTGYE